MRITLLLFLIGLAGISFAQSPEALAPDIAINKILDVPSNSIRIDRDPTTNIIYYVRQNGAIYEVDLENGTDTFRYSNVDHGQNVVQGFTIGPDGAFYVVGNAFEAGDNIGIIMRGKGEGEERVWSKVAESEPYRESGLRDHLFNAIAVTPDGSHLIVNSGSRTDHGEIGNEGREFPITSAYFKIPIDAEDLILYNDADSLAPYLFADGLRNSFDMAFSPQGELFSVENCGARDDAEELNWVREGHHYGFPWRLANQDNPQRFADFDPPDSDNLIVDGINMESTFYNDPNYPDVPEGILFTDPVENIGPDADHFRDTTDAGIKDASDLGQSLYTFTPHSSPLAIVFDMENILSDPYSGDAFVMSYNNPDLRKYKPFNDPGGDILHVKLNKVEEEDRYTATITRIVVGFDNPVDNVMSGNKIYVLENGSGAALWEVSLPSQATAINKPQNNPLRFELLQNYPNPFNPTTMINYQLSINSDVSLKIYDISGKEVATLVNEKQSAGMYSVNFDASGLSSGIYIYRLYSDDLVTERRMLLLK